MVKRLLIVLFAWLALPAVAHAADATIAMRELPAGSVRSLAGVAAPSTFDLVGLHWQGPGSVRFRTRTVGGRWSTWRLADVDDHVSASSPEGALSRGWHLGEPYWVGASDRIDYRLVGEVRRLRAYYVWSPVEPTRLRTVTLAGSPGIVPRSGWSADDKILRGPPVYAPAVRYAVVHHTAGTNAYTAVQSPAIVRGIELYHVEGNGWKDIGYNFLVDKYGHVFEGRYGGIDRNVVGAHAEGFNTGSIGVSVLGNYSSHAISAAAQRALVRLLAWRLDVAHVDPVSTLTVASGGNARFRAGVAVTLRAISGHRDTGFTDCPGTPFYRQLPAIARQVAALGLPKLYAPVVRGKLGGPVTFSARLSSSLPWTVTITSAGQMVAQGSGTGAAVSWTWDSTTAAPGSYAWTIDAGSTVRPASGTIAGGPPPPPPTPVLTSLAVAPATISPNGDGYSDTATVSYTLGARAAVTAVIRDATGPIVQTLFESQEQSARPISFALPADQLPDGHYTLSVSAIAGDGRTASADAPFVVDRVLAGLTALPSPFSPNGGTIAFAFTLGKPAQVTITVFQAGVALAVVFDGMLEAGPQSIAWNGQLPAAPLPNGHYDVVVVATDDLGQVTQSAGFDVVSG
jgi:N-acetylmuramoyl-L-alanine amidase-like protein